MNSPSSSCLGLTQSAGPLHSDFVPSEDFSNGKTWAPVCHEEQNTEDTKTNKTAIKY